MLGLALIVALIWGSIRIRKASLRFLETKANTGTGPKWEQIAPMDECFDFYEEDDL